MIKSTNELQKESENKVIIDFAKQFNVTPMQIIQQNKRPQISDIRHLYCKLRCEKHGVSYSATAREIGRSHTAVRYAVKRINNMLCKNDEKIVAMWEKVKDVPGYYI